MNRTNLSKRSQNRVKNHLSEKCFPQPFPLHEGEGRVEGVKMLVRMKFLDFWYKNLEVFYKYLSLGAGYSLNLFTLYLDSFQKLCLSNVNMSP
jgi:hypothetical protein